jgi:Carboxypeptidase regulatory-like domain
MRRDRLLGLWVGILCLLMLGGSAAAQSDRGTIAGSVLDSSGAAVGGAAITITGADTGSVYKTVSSPEGNYRVSDIAVGRYDVTAEGKGFKLSLQKGVLVQINTVTALNITLEPGNVKEEVTVLADAPTLQTEATDIGTVVDKREILELPLALGGQGVLRAPEAFVFLTPGTAGPGTADNSNGVFQAKLAGGQNFGNEIILDGASTARADSGSSFDQTAPSVEALQEFKVTTSTIPADFGRTSGGVESFVTRSGTNSYHGGLYEIFRNEDLNANTWFNDFNLGAIASGISNQSRSLFVKPLDRKNDYGGTFGGPVRIPKLYNGHDKSFFFFSWEQYRQTQGSNVQSTVPTVPERTGDFSDRLGGPVLDGSGNPIINPCDGSQVLQGQIFDPTTTQTIGGAECRTAFLGNKVPVNAVAQNIVNFVPQPTSNALKNNYTLVSHNPILATTMSFRIDQSLSDKSKIFFSYSSRDNENINGQPAFPQPLDTTFFSSFFTHYERVGWDYFVSPKLMNHFNVGLNRVNSNSVAGAVNGTDWDAKIGLQGANGPTFPPLTFSGNYGYASYGDPNADDDLINGLVVSDSVSWQHGRHNLHFGLDWRAFQSSIIDQSHQSPSINFTPGETAFQSSLENSTGNEYASFLLGVTDSASLAVRSEQPRFTNYYYAAYVQDSFKVNQSLLLTLGVRYEVETPRKEANDDTFTIDPTVPNPGATGVLGAMVFAGNGPGRSGRSGAWAKTWLKDIAPRLGFSYAPDLFHRNTIFRGGYGIYYAGLDYADFGQALTDGFTASPSFASSDHFTPSPVLLSTGIPPYPPPPNLDPAQDNGGSGGGFGGPTYVAPSYGRPGMVENWSFEVEHQFATDLILNIGYVGQHATHLRSSLAEINNLNPKFFSLGSGLTQSIVGNTVGVNPPFPQFEALYGPGTVAQALRPFPQYESIDTDCCLENLGQSTYNALLASLQRRFHNGLNLLASYTWSKTLTDADSALPAFAGFSGGGVVQNSYNLNSEKSVSYQDIPQTFVVSYVYELPIGRNKRFLSGGALGRALGGWEVGGVQRYQSGQPLAICCATSIPGFDGSIRFKRVPGQSLRSNAPFNFVGAYFGLPGETSGCTASSSGQLSGGPNQYFNCAALVDPNAPVSSVAGTPYGFGDMPRISGEVRSQGYVNEDFSILKRTAITERMSMVLKGELFNAFNRHIFTRPDSGPYDSTFGVPFGTVDTPRNVQFTLRFEF